MGFERTLEYMGETLTVTEWARRFAMPAKILFDRINSGWDVEKALTSQVRGWKKLEAKAQEYEKDDDKSHRKAIFDTEWGDQGGIL